MTEVNNKEVLEAIRKQKRIITKECNYLMDPRIAIQQGRDLEKLDKMQDLLEGYAWRFGEDN